eukprot:TRINITY_DN23528_c0_g1_i1.p1 TRINITY_DN23528_c0_g1~~TRINITY_DN23528_c0_g1_i1.p1  ORF type:complete len:805 (+),score=142.66 TRINITY_DN23528_c0_g1_i1:43-2457(+)
MADAVDQPLDYRKFEDVHLFCGRWVRSDSKYENWYNYMKWFGMDDAKAMQEIVEPQIHIFLSASKERLTLVHQLPWREGLQAEYTIEIDNEYHPIPEKLFASARSSWKVNKEASWLHRWDARGLCCEQKLPVNGKDHILRYWRSFLNPNEIRIDVHLFEVSASGEETEAIHTVRFFQRMPFKERWTASAAQFFSGTDVEANLRTSVEWMRKAKAKGADLIVMPENSNRDRNYFVAGKPSREMCWEHAETLDGAFVTGVRAACRELGIWASLGVDLRGKAKPTVHIGIILIRPDGEIEGVVKKHVLWDYEYTLFEPGGEPYQVFDTELGRLGVLCCADGIVPEAARVLSLMGAQVLLNSLNSRGPDEMRVHIPLRSIENGVWHVASNTVGNPNTVGLLWPWTGGSEVCDPQGNRVVASEDVEEVVCAEVRPWEAELKTCSWTKDIWKHRRPELYGAMTRPLEEVPAAAMYGPAPKPGTPLAFEGPDVLPVAMMQLSAVHTRQCTEWMTQRQVSYASRRGALLGVLPSLWCFKRGEVAKDPGLAAEYSEQVLVKVCEWAKESSLHVCCSLVEKEGDKFYHSAYLVGSTGEVLTKYRKTHLNLEEQSWASAGDQLCPVLAVPSLGRVAMMIEDEVWVPELSRCLALEGVETVLHPADWDTAWAGELAATERAGENRFHLVSVTRLDSNGKLGSQTTLAGEYIGGEPIPLMRYAQGVWCRYGVEEQVIVELKRRQPHCKMMGDHLDVLKKRWPELYGVCTQEELFQWREVTSRRPGDFPDEHPYLRGDFGRKRKYDCRFSEDFSSKSA